MRKRNLELEKKIVNDNVNGTNNKELCLKYYRKRGSIQKILIRNNIPLRNGCDVTKIYKINENYFEKIDNQDKAYILGLLFSDGNIFNNTVKINLIKTDTQILYDIANKIYYDNKFQITFLKEVEKIWKNGKTYITKPQALLMFTRKKIADDLRRHGLIENKSFKIRFPVINKKYYKDFIRGYFDGDGHFHTSKKYKNNNKIQITSNNNFISDLKNIIEESLNITCNIMNSEIKNISRLNIYGNVKVKKFLDWIYKDSDLKLNRKYAHYINAY
jgi:hypothetical protein